MSLKIKIKEHLIKNKLIKNKAILGFYHKSFIKIYADMTVSDYLNDFKEKHNVETSIVVRNLLIKKMFSLYKDNEIMDRLYKIFEKEEKQKIKINLLDSDSVILKYLTYELLPIVLEQQNILYDKDIIKTYMF